MHYEAPARLINHLIDHPVRLRRAIAGLTDAHTRTCLTPGTWSVLEYLAHLRASDDILAPRCLAVLTRERPPLPAFDERRWAEIAGYTERTADELVTGLVVRRAELVQALRRCGAAEWQRLGQHEVAGPLSLFQIVGTLSDHEAEHCADIERLVAALRHQPGNLREPPCE